MAAEEIVVALRRVEVRAGRVASALKAAGGRSISPAPGVDERVAGIIAAVRERGDAAVAELTREIEGRDPRAGLSYEIPRAELEAARGRIDSQVAASLEAGARRVRRFHEEQIEPEYAIDDGALRLRVAPLSRVGLYVPGGTALYPSSVIMTAVPATVAGVGQVVMVTPGASDETLAAAAIAGVDRVFEIGGAQAVAALAYGTESVPRVDKIVGPGNQWVAAAKRQVFGDVDIDSIAGPSEVLIIADDSANPAFVAADLLAQAEHDVEARPVLVTTSPALASAVDAELSRQLESLPRTEIAGESLRRHGIAFLCGSLDVAVELANLHAPEHLEVLTEDAGAVAERLHTAGAIFVGPYSPEAAGDYVAGPNHVLPTGGAARYASPLGVYDYRKRTSILAQSRELLAEQRHDIVNLATVESLDAHARSVEIRFQGVAPTGGSKHDHRIAPGRGTEVGDPVKGASYGGGGPPAVKGASYGGGEPPEKHAGAARLARRLLRPGLEEVSAYRVAHPEGISVYLHANESPFSLPDDIRAGLAERLAAVPLHRYPDARASELRAVLADWLDASGDQLCLGDGSDELIHLLCAALSRPPGGRSSAAVVVPTPSFTVYAVAARAAGMRPVEVPLTPRFELDEAALESALREHRPNLAFFARPNNPTGTLWSREVILGLAERHPDTLVVVDEAYIAYGGDSLRDQIGARDNLILMGTLSKMGLASARTGFLLAPAPLIAAVERIRPPYNIGGLNQVAAAYLLAEHREWIEARCVEVAAERTRVERALLDRGLEVFPSSANLLLLRAGKLGDGHALWQKLAERGVLVRDLDRPGPLAGCLRVTIGAPEDNDALLAAAKDALA